MWTVGVKVVLVVTQYPKGMRLVVEQHAIGALGSDAANEAFRERVRPGCARWRLDHIDAFGGEHRVEGPGDLRVPVSDQEPKRRGSLTQVHHHVTGLLGDPNCGRMGGHAEDVYPPSREATVPRQQRRRRDDPMLPQLTRQATNQHGQHGPVWPRQARPTKLPTQHSNLMA